MSESILASIIEEWAERDWEKYANAPKFNASKKHDRAMKRIFKRYQRNTRKLRPQVEIRARAVRKRIIVALVVIILAIFTGFTAAYFISRSFRSEVHSDNTELFPINMENCPTVIEDKYYLSELSDGFEIISTSSNPISITTIYKNNATGKTISFQQSVKEDFSMHFNTEKGEFVEVEINGHSGVTLEITIDNQVLNGIIWDSGDYILQISSNLDKNELLYLAKSAKVVAGLNS